MVDEKTYQGSHWEPKEKRELERRLAAIAGNVAGDWSFAVAERGPVAAIKPDWAQPAASTIKVPLLLTALSEVARGAHQLSDPVALPAERTGGSGVLNRLGSVKALRLDETLELMVMISDNTATNMVIDLLGLELIERRLREAGLVSTRLGRHTLDRQAVEDGRDNVATAGELAWLLDRLCTTDFLPSDLVDTALLILERQQLNDRMPAYLPADVKCLHKTGDLSGVRHDVGILRFDERHIAFAALSSGLPGTDDTVNGSGIATETIGAAARAVVDLARAQR